MYEKINFETHGSDVQIIDLRSDTISRPTPEMREAMFHAEVGDDGYGEDPTVALLEQRAAELLGKDDAVFVASGTMANLISIMVHCSQRGCELLCGDNGHTFLLEQAGASQVAGVQQSILRNNPDGTFDLDELRKKIKKGDAFAPISTLIVIENTHNMCGGKVLPLDWIEKVGNIANEYNLKLHMDGARLMNAAAYLKVPPKRVCRDVDTVCFCLSKGLGAPVGSILAGDTEFIAKARRTKKLLGGGWRQAGILAAAGLVALDKMIDRLQIDHDHALKIAKAIHATKSSIFKVDLAHLHTNILLMYVDHSKVEIKDLQRRLQTVLTTDTVKASVRCTSLNHNCVRFVLYWEISREDVDKAIEKITLVIREYDEMFRL